MVNVAQAWTRPGAELGVMGEGGKMRRRSRPAGKLARSGYRRDEAKRNPNPGHSV